MHEQVQIPDELVRAECICAYTNTWLNNCNNAITIYLLVLHLYTC